METLYKNKKWLKEQYIDKRLTQQQISKICGIAKTTIRTWLKKFQISMRSHSEANIKVNSKYVNKKWLEEQYINKKLSSRKIAEICKTSCSVIWRWLKIYNIPIRIVSEALTGIIRTNEMNKKSSELRKGIPRLSFRGKNSSNWKGGITPEDYRIRNSIEYRLWREAVFARDNWTCQKCNQRGEELRAHHIENFADYPELRIAIDNGITFCEECHKQFHIKYGKQKTTEEQIIEFLNIEKVK